MNYIEVVWNLKEEDIQRVYLIDMLDTAGADSIIEEPERLMAYFPEEAFKKELLTEHYAFGELPKFDKRTVQQQNWNETWEKSFDPIEIEKKLYLRASFHASRAEEFDREIVITPKMSFGTGHHSTTYLMLSYLLEYPALGKRFLDMGAGTGVLAILAAQQGAKEVWAVDIDEWAFENAKENAEMNGVANSLDLRIGSSEQIKDIECDIIYANINRNILLDQIADYSACLKNGGALFMSGFYTEDLPLIAEEARKYGFELEDSREQKNWVAARWQKQV